MILEPPKLIWLSREWGPTGSPLVPHGGGLIYAPSRSSWFLVNENPLALTIHKLQLTSRYKRWFGDPVERVWEVNDTYLRPGQDIKVRAPRPPLFAAPALHTFQIIATYNNVRYKLSNYQRSELFMVNQPLTIRLLERDWS